MQVIHIIESFAGGNFELLSILTKKIEENEYIIVHGKRENTPKNYRERFPDNTVFIPWENAKREIDFIADVKALVELLRLLKKYAKKKSVIHLHSSKAGFLGRMAAFLLGKKRQVIYTAHGVSFLRRDVSRNKQFLYIALERIANLFGGRIVACSNSERESFNEHGIKNVLLINNGVKVEDNRGKEQIKTGHKVVIGTLARITYPKNPKKFNEIAKYFIKNKNVRFLWIGDGELRSELTARNIEITGWVSKKEVERLLKKIDIYISTSLWEGMPLSVLEAMVCEKPLVISNCVGNRDLIKGNGYLFNNIEEGILRIEELIQKDELRKNFAQQSLKNVRAYFTDSIMIDAYRLLYKSIGGDICN